MKKIALLGLLVTLFLSCEKSDEVRVELTADYFPLQVGNQWVAELAGKTIITEITSVQGKEYYAFLNDYGTTTLYRVENDRVYARSTTSGEDEEMKYDLAASEDATWEYGVGYVTLLDRNARVVIGDTTIDNCLHYSFHNKNLIDYGRSVWIAPGIGIIQQTCQECYGSAYEVMQLQTAIVKGKVIAFNTILETNRYK